jgi:hypothetical protein
LHRRAWRSVSGDGGPVSSWTAQVRNSEATGVERRPCAGGPDRPRGGPPTATGPCDLCRSHGPQALRNSRRSETTGWVKATARWRSPEGTLAIRPSRGSHLFSGARGTPGSLSRCNSDRLGDDSGNRQATRARGDCPAARPPSLLGVAGASLRLPTVKRIEG